MALTRSVLVTTPIVRKEEVNSVRIWQARPFKLQVGDVNVMLTYRELSNLVTDAEHEIRDYLGEEHE